MYARSAFELNSQDLEDFEILRGKSINQGGFIELRAVSRPRGGGREGKGAGGRGRRGEEAVGDVGTNAQQHARARFTQAQRPRG